MNQAVRFVVCFFVWAFVVHGAALADKPTAPETVPGATLVDAEQVIGMAQSVSALVVIDSRRVEEFLKGHIQGARNLLDTDMTVETLQAIVPQLDTPVVFYCNGPRCLRSSNASALAASWGYKNIYWFRGGWRAWTEKQYPIAY